MTEPPLGPEVAASPSSAADAPSATASRERLWMPLAVLALGIASVVLLLVTDALRRRSAVEDTALLLAISEIQLAVATSHLWLEEHVTGDQVELEEISGALDRARLLVGVMLGERLPPSDLPDLVALQSASLLQHATQLRFEVDQFRALSDQRQQGYGEGEPVGIGSALDIRYDRIFNSLLGVTRELEQSLEARRRQNQRNSQRLYSAIVLAWSGLILLAVFGLWTRERYRRRSERALAESQRQLVQAQKMDAVGRLAGGLAHDINNYLASVRGSCELVTMKRQDDEWLMRKMDTAVLTTVKAAALIDRLLAFGRKQPVQLRVVHLNQVVEGLEPMMQRLLGDDIRLVTELAEDLWNCKVDLSQMEQIIVNLLVNAREAMPTGGDVLISTHNARVASEGSSVAPVESVALRVSDVGPGVPPEIRDKIFEPFFTTKRGGTGLGLATIYGIAQQHGGSVRFFDWPQGGTTFEVTLPRSLEAEEPVQLPTSRDGARPGGTERLLLVDDNESFRESTCALLEALGYRVTQASDGIEALRAFEQRSGGFDLVLSDVVMPGLSGRELMERLAGSNVPLILMSGYAANVLEQHGVHEEDVHFLKKPFSTSDLTRLIRDLLDERQSARVG